MNKTTRSAPVSACYDCLSRDHNWLARYAGGWLAIAVFGLVAFRLMTDLAAIAMQSVFFAMLLAQIVRPIFSAHSFGRQTSIKSGC